MGRPETQERLSRTKERDTPGGRQPCRQLCAHTHNLRQPVSVRSEAWVSRERTILMLGATGMFRRSLAAAERS